MFSKKVKNKFEGKSYSFTNTHQKPRVSPISIPNCYARVKANFGLHYLFLWHHMPGIDMSPSCNLLFPGIVHHCLLLKDASVLISCCSLHILQAETISAFLEWKAVNERIISGKGSLSFSSFVCIGFLGCASYVWAFITENEMPSKVTARMILGFQLSHFNYPSYSLSNLSDCGLLLALTMPSVSSIYSASFYDKHWDLILI